nr:NAD(P)-binding domain-containing protein [Rhizobium leguminosarum]
MGSAIIRELHRKGQSVVAWNRSHAPLEALSERHPTDTDLEFAVDGCDAIIVVLSSYSAARSVLGSLKAASLAGKTVINLTSGSAEKAAEMCTWPASVGIDYLDGSIWALPSMIGGSTTVISCAGPENVWEQVESLMKAVGGASFHAGEAIEIGNVHEACFLGAFYMTAQHCFIESVARARQSGIDFQTIAPAVAPSIDLLGTSLDDLVRKLMQNDETADETRWTYGTMQRKHIEIQPATMAPRVRSLIFSSSSSIPL